jgi:hypothetical protein
MRLVSLAIAFVALAGLVSIDCFNASGSSAGPISGKRRISPR